MTLRLATRSSPLALEQARRVQARLAACGVTDVEIVTTESEGDLRRDVPISALGGWGAFTNAIDRAVIEGRADVAVHSAKDLPSSVPTPELDLAAVPERADARDVLVGAGLEELAPGGLVLTGAPRRRAQLAHLRPDLCFGELRGNVKSRLDKLPDGGAVVVALAALERLGIELAAAEVLPLSVMLPQVGQGALALRCRVDDEASRASLEAIDDAIAHRCLLAERAFLAELGGGCRSPIGAYATSQAATGLMEIEAMIASGDGHVMLRRRLRGEDPTELGREVARQLLSEDGGAALLEGP